jgi:hypothetical protein
MITLNKNSLKYKDSDGNMRDSGVLFASEKEKEWELIEVITIEEDGIMNITRTEEPDGTPYEFKNIYIYAVAPTKSTENGTLAIYGGDGVNKWRNSIMINTFLNKNYDNVKAWGTFLESNGWLIPISSNGQNWSPATLFTNMSKPVSAFIMKSIMIGAGGSTQLPVGLTLEIYAIRA